MCSTCPENCFLRHALQIPNPDRSPLYDVRNPARASCKGQRMRSDVSRTIYLTPIVRQPVFALSGYDVQPSLREGLPSRSWRSQRRLVEPDGIEPTTSCLQSTRSPS